MPMWFVSEMHPNGVTEWMVRPIAVAAIVQLVELDRQPMPRQAPKRLGDDNGDQCGYPTDPPAAPPEVCGGTGSIVTPNGIMTAPKPAVAVNDDWNGATSGGTNESSVKPVTVFAGKSTGR